MILNCLFECIYIHMYSCMYVCLDKHVYANTYDKHMNIQIRIHIRRYKKNKYSIGNSGRKTYSLCLGMDVNRLN